MVLSTPLDIWRARSFTEDLDLHLQLWSQCNKGQRLKQPMSGARGRCCFGSHYVSVIIHKWWWVVWKTGFIKGSMWIVYLVSHPGQCDVQPLSNVCYPTTNDVWSDYLTVNSNWCGPVHKLCTNWFCYRKQIVYSCTVYHITLNVLFSTNIQQHEFVYIGM